MKQNIVIMCSCKKTISSIANITTLIFYSVQLPHSRICSCLDLGWYFFENSYGGLTIDNSLELEIAIVKFMDGRYSKIVGEQTHYNINDLSYSKPADNKHIDTIRSEVGRQP